MRDFNNIISIDLFESVSPIMKHRLSCHIQVKLDKPCIKKCLAEAIRKKLFNASRSTKENKSIYKHSKCYVLVSEYPTVDGFINRANPIFFKDWINYGIEDDK